MAFRLLTTDHQAIQELHRLTFIDHDQVFHSSPSSSGRATRNIDLKTLQKQSVRLCKRLKTENIIHQKQFKLCKRTPNLPHVIVTANKEFITQCKRKFRYEPWNCGDRTARIKVLQKGTYFGIVTLRS